MRRRRWRRRVRTTRTPGRHGSRRSSIRRPRRCLCRRSKWHSEEAPGGGKATAAAAASSKAVKEEAKEDIKAIRAELLAAKEREEQSKHADAYKEAKEEADDARESADKAQRKVERLREFEEEAAEIRAKSKREQEARAKALQERERKRAEQRTKLEEELAARESERHKQVLKLKEVLKEHADAKKRIAEEDAPEEGEVDLNPASARATPASGARGGSLAAHIASADNSRDGPSPSRTTVPTVPLRAALRQDSNQGLDRWGSGTPGAGPGGWERPASTRVARTATGLAWGWAWGWAWG